jgi:hypothetical protein
VSAELSDASASDSRKRSMLFVSCDLVGSTALKQAGEPWEEILLSFYIDFPERLGEIAAHDHVPFELWKPIGDELVFKVPVQREADVTAGLRSWLKALHVYETDSSFQKNVGATTKGGAFIATFPGPDVEASVLRDPRTRLPTAPDLAQINDAALAARDYNRHVFDYFGPSFDTGFRVIGQSTPRHFTLSVEVAWSLIRAAENHDGPGAPLDDVVFLGGRELKGVWSGRDYPLFAIDRRHNDDINVAMKKMLGQNNFDVDDAKRLLRTCVLSDELPTFLYLPQSEFKPLRSAPQDALATLRKSGDVVPSGIDEQVAAEDEGQADSDAGAEPFEMGDRLLTMEEVLEEGHFTAASFQQLQAEWLAFPEPDRIVENEDGSVKLWLRSTMYGWMESVVAKADTSRSRNGEQAET